jgi:hypothetical protein
VAVPKQIALSKADLASVRSAAVKVDAAALRVELNSRAGLSSAHGWVGVLSPLAGLLSASVEAAGRSYADAALSKTQREHLVISDLETHLGDGFLRQMAAFHRFAVSYALSTDWSQLLAQGHDVLLCLKVEELCLKPYDAERLGLYVSAWGTITDLRTGRVLWKRLESLLNREVHTLAEYQADEAQLLKHVVEDSLDGLATRMASAIVYADE